MILRNRPGRIAAAVAAVVAASATTMMAVAAGTASAGEPGRCVQNVNVREEPEADARIVALCEAGKQVELGETRDGFVQIKELGGWAAEDYVKADDASASGERGGDTSTGSATDDADERSSDDHSSRDGSGSEREASADSDTDSDSDTAADTATDDVDDDLGLLG